MRLSLFTILLLLLVTLSSVSNAQESNFTDGELERLGTNLNEVSGNYYLNAQSRNVEGDPYLNSEWLRGKVKINDKAQSEDLMLRLNTEDNILEFTKGKQIYLMDSSKIEGFTIYGQPENVVFRNGFESEKNDINTSTFLRIIYHGNVKMVAHHTSALKKDIPTYGSATIKDEYVDNTDYYIIDQSRGVFETKLKRRDILKILDKKKRDQISDYAKQEDLDFDEEADLAKILKYYDELKSGS